MPSPTEPATGNRQLFYRAATLDRAAVDPETRTAPLTFSSEARVKRWYGIEILRHGPDNVDLARLNSFGAVLFNHDPDRIVGPVQSAQLGNDRRGHAGIKFDQTPEGDTALSRAISGSLRGVSVGYQIHTARRVLEDETYEDPDLGPVRGPALIATKWEPIEISLTPVPADAGVGIGRDLTRSLDGIEIEPQSIEPQRSHTMDDRLRKYLESRGLDPSASEEDAWTFLAQLPEKDTERAAPQEPVPAAEPEPDPKAEPEPEPDTRNVLAEIRDDAVAAGLEPMALRMAADGKTADQIRSAMLRELAKSRGEPLGPGDPETKSTLDQIEDDDLLRGLTAPLLVRD